MKKGYYIHFQGRLSIGVSKKIDMQLEEFEKHFDIHELEVETVKRNIVQRVFGLLPMMSIKRNYKDALEKLDQPDFIYVRRNVADRAYVNFWKEIKRRYPKCKIIIEIFTYPYDKDDFGKWNAWPFFIKEVIYRPQLKKYVDRFVTYSNDKMIFGIPTIITTNGVLVEYIRLVRGEYKRKQITLIGVAYMQRQHGYERVIEGLHQYYHEGIREYQVNLLLVGDGPEKKRYQELVCRYGIEEYVHFYPTTSGEALDDLYDQSDLALIAFGMYKVGYWDKIGAIKSRECLAKGMPMVSGSGIDVLEDDYPYLKIYPNDRSAVDINELVNFFKQITSDVESKAELAGKIRGYAKERIDMETVLKPVIDYINE